MWEILLTLLVILLISFCILLKYIRGNQDYWTKRGVEKPSIICTFKESMKKPFHEIDHLYYNSLKSKGIKNYGGLVELRKPLLFVLDPELIKSILVKDFNHFINRRSLGLSSNEKFFHNMLFFMEDQPWKDMRATISPTFTTGKIKKMNELLNESGAKVVKYLVEQIESANKKTTEKIEFDDDDGHGIEIELRDVFGKYTLDIIASVAFGIDSENFTKPNSIFYQMSQRINDSVNMSLKLALKFLTLTMAPKLFEWLQLSIMDSTALNFFANVTEQSITQREAQEIKKRNDFLQLMIDAKNGLLLDELNNSSGNNEEEIRLKDNGAAEGNRVTLTNDTILANCVLFFIAGFDTSESLLMFTTYELALNPEIQEKLYEEIDDTLDIYNGELTYEAVSSMTYLDMVISEALRKYPPAFRLERRTNLEYKIPDSNLLLEKDSLVIIPVYGIHHDPDIYPNPEEFLPERFTPQAKSKRHPYTYLPFGTGPRSCIAMRFALAEAKSAIAHLVHKFRFEPTVKTPVPLTFKKSASALKPTDGLFLQIKLRK